jgi:hypothetical protein
MKCNENPFRDFHGVRCGKTRDWADKGAVLQSAVNPEQKEIKITDTENVVNMMHLSQNN